MRKTYLFLLPLFFSVFVVSAHAEGTQTLRETRVENRQEVRELREDNRQETRELRVENRQEIRSGVAANHAVRLERRFQYYYTRLSGIATRLQTRLNLLKAEGKDITSAQAKLTAAASKLDTAQSLGVQAVAAFRAIDPAKFEEQKAEAQAARDLANQARVAFKDTLALLKATLQEVK